MSSKRACSPAYKVSIDCSNLRVVRLRFLSDFYFIFKCRFYDEGYRDGFSHGRIHGLIEGRALGRENGFEVWEELGFYEGFSKTWMAVLVKQGRSDEYVLYSPISPSINSMFFIYFIHFVIYLPSPSGVHHNTSDTSSTPSHNSHAPTPPRRIPLLTRSTSRNSSVKSDRVIKCSARPSACVQGYKVQKSQRWRT